MTFTLGPAVLFCPADRPERYAKAAQRADAVILDLEDAVAADAKPGARDALIEHPLPPERVIVRVNPADTDDHLRDLDAVRRTGYRTVMLAKASGYDDLALLTDFDVVALCETPAGVVAAEHLAQHPSVVALMWGAEDLVAALGGTSSRHVDARYRDVAVHARSRVLLAAAAHEKAAIDAVYLDIDDHAGLAEEAKDAAASGFAASACIHPGQVAVIRDAYRPDVDELAFATAVLAAATSERGVFRFEGRMVDQPVLVHARRVLARAAAASR